MMEINILCVDLYHIINWFYIYSFFGWAFESTYVSLRCRRVVNRGFITGPLCTIYGAGGVLIYLALSQLPDNIFIIYIGGMIVASVIEYFTSLIMEVCFHTRWWDYSNDPLNINGRVCIGASLGWGFFSLLLMKVIHPFVVSVCDLYPVNVGTWGVYVITLVYIVDFCISAKSAVDLSSKLEKLSKIFEGLTADMELERPQAVTNVIEGAAMLKEAIQSSETINSAKDTLYSAKDKVVDLINAQLGKLPDLGLEDEGFTAKMKKTASKYVNELKTTNSVQKRFLTAYPKMRTASLPDQIHLDKLKELFTNR